MERNTSVVNAELNGEKSRFPKKENWGHYIIKNEKTCFLFIKNSYSSNKDYIECCLIRVRC